jgi:hypothetical protein
MCRAESRLQDSFLISDNSTSHVLGYVRLSDNVKIIYEGSQRIRFPIIYMEYKQVTANNIWGKGGSPMAPDQDYREDPQCQVLKRFSVVIAMHGRALS